MSTYIGIDTSLTSTGVAVIQRGEIQLRRVQSKGARDDSLTDRRARLRRIVAEILLRFPGHPSDHSAPMLVAIEGPSYGQRQQAGVHDRSGLWWLLVDRLARAEGVALMEIAPKTRAKYATGLGNAGKDAVLAAVCRRYPQAEVTGNDVADALVLAAIAARLDGHPIEEFLPQTHLSALDKLTAVAGDH